MRTVSAAAKPCQGDSSKFYLITGGYSRSGFVSIMVHRRSDVAEQIMKRRKLIMELEHLGNGGLFVDRLDRLRDYQMKDLEKLRLLNILLVGSNVALHEKEEYVVDMDVPCVSMSLAVCSLDLPFAQSQFAAQSKYLENLKLLQMETMGGKWFKGQGCDLEVLVGRLPARDVYVETGAGKGSVAVLKIVFRMKFGFFAVLPLSKTSLQSLVKVLACLLEHVIEIVADPSLTIALKL
ncbi:hypothetical protein Tco_0103814 [Tanacetum coccineum]